MHVAALQQYLQALAEAVRAAGSKTAADDLQRAATALTPFAGWTIAQWADFLHQAEAYQRTGLVPIGRSRSRGAKSLDESKLATAQQALQQLEDQITQPQFSFAQLSRRSIGPGTTPAAGRLQDQESHTRKNRRTIPRTSSAIPAGRTHSDYLTITIAKCLTSNHIKFQRAALILSR